MILLFMRSSFGRVGGAGALALLGSLVICSPSRAQTLNCVEVISSGSTSCTDAGGVDSTCSSAKCPAEFTLTGVGGACAAGDRKIKSLVPRVDDGSVTMMCEKQGVDPQAVAVCCQLRQ
jgi:hypothetical protein